MKKPHILIITNIILFTSFSFSQSGAAKSLEIGNKWVYQYQEWQSCDWWNIPNCVDGYTRDTTYSLVEVIGDTIINDIVYAILNRQGGNQRDPNTKWIERADSNIVYHINWGFANEYSVVDFRWTIEDDIGDWAVWSSGLFTLDSRYVLIYDKYSPTHSKKFIEGIGLYYSHVKGEERRTYTDLFCSKVDGVKIFGCELPQFNILPEFQYTNKSELKFKLNNNTTSLVNSVKYNINNTQWFDVLPNTEVLSISVEEEGNYNIEFSILNVFDESYSDSVWFIFDMTVPIIQLADELNSSVYLNSISHNSSIKYDVIDDNFDKISYILNEADTVWVDQQSSSIALVNLNNRNDLEITAYDLAGNITTKAYEIFVDSKAPEIEFEIPLESINLLINNGNQLSLSYKVIEKYFDRIGYSINNSEWNWSEEQESTLSITVENDDDHIQIKAIDLAGNESEIYEINIEKIADFKLTQNFPNPFNPTTQISYELPQDSEVELIIYNSLGEEVNNLVNRSQSVGRYTINWNGLNSNGEQVPGGIYFYTLKTKDFTQTKKMLLLK